MYNINRMKNSPLTTTDSGFVSKINTNQNIREKRNNNSFHKSSNAFSNTENKHNSHSNNILVTSINNSTMYENNRF